MDNEEILRVQAYLRRTFGNEAITLKRSASGDMLEVCINDEFIGTLFRDDEEDDVSYAFNMAILEYDVAGGD